MRRTLVLGVVLVALAATGSALASYTPRLVVTQSSAAGTTTIHVTIPKADDATSHAVIYVPTAAAPTLNQTVGTQIGSVTAQVNAKAISPDAILPLTGTVVVADANDATLAAAATACTGTATHAATWLLVLSAAGQTLNVPAWVDTTTGAETAFGAAKVTVCLPSPDVPEAQGGAKFGSKLLDVEFTVKGVFTPANAPIVAWPSIFTPYVAGTATANPQGTVTAIGIATIPTFTFTAKPMTGHRVALAGKVTVAGIAAPDQTISVFNGKRRIASTKTKANGTFAAIGYVKNANRTYVVRAKLTAADTDVTSRGCALVPTGAPTCVSATAAGGIFFSKGITVHVR